jgi:nitroreductase
MFELISNPWDVLESEFPVMGTPAEQLRFLLNYAVLAPSRHNAQPWLFKVDGDTVELYADRSRSLPVMDPDDRELTIGCGAALANLIIAIRHFGYTPAVEIHSHHDQGRLLARVTLEKGVRATSEEQRLFSAILQRRTNRQPFEDRPLPASLLSALEEMAMQEGASLRFVREEETRYALASLIATGDRMLWTDERFRQEVATWTRPVESQARDGVPAYALCRRRGLGLILQPAH